MRDNSRLLNGPASSYVKFSQKSSALDHIWSQKKVCLEQNIFIGLHCMEQGHFMLHFITFHNVYIREITTKASNVYAYI